MKTQAALLRSLRSPEEIDPAPGFYARVIQRIEETTKDSIWAFFIYSPFSKRLVYASLTLAILIGSYVISRESSDGHLSSPDELVAAQQVDPDAPVVGSQAQQRDAVLVNLVSYQDSGRTQGTIQ